MHRKQLSKKEQHAARAGYTGTTPDRSGVGFAEAAV
jgi:hypothetical protein